jgi:CheY-like chemotaxis protein
MCETGQQGVPSQCHATCMQINGKLELGLGVQTTIEARPGAVDKYLSVPHSTAKDSQVRGSQRLNFPLADSAIENHGTTPSVRILVVDDFPTIRRMVKHLVNSHPRFEVVGEAQDGHDAVVQAEVLKPDVVVINVTMPTMSGFEAARRIRSRLPDCAIVILSSHKDEQFIAEARTAGAIGYVKKSDADQELVRAIELAVKGEEFFVLE